MKVSLIVIVTGALILSSCSGGDGASSTQELMEASKAELATALAEREQLLALVRDIALDMERIKELENILTLSGSQSIECPSRRAQVLSDINTVRQTLRQRRHQLAELEARLRQSSLFSDNLQSTIEVLRGQIDSRGREIETLHRNLTAANETIRILTGEVDSLESTMAAVSENYETARNASEQLASELNTCYYVCASKSDLKVHNILEKGFLKKTRLMQGEFDRDYFMVGDKRSLDTIIAGSKRVKVLTNHPQDSYCVVTDSGCAVIVITAPDRFWSLTNYLVVQTD